jgi:hypothetical protein
VQVQRRGTAQQEYAAVLPAPIVTILTAGDKVEHEREEAHVASHAKFGDVIRKTFTKLEQEEKRYRYQCFGYVSPICSLLVDLECSTSLSFL